MRKGLKKEKRRNPKETQKSKSLKGRVCTQPMLAIQKKQCGFRLLLGANKKIYLMSEIPTAAKKRSRKG